MLALYLSMLGDDEEDRRAFADLYTQFYSKLAAVAARYFPNDPKMAEDAVHNAFLQVIRHFEKISEIPCNKLLLWLVCIVKNESITLLRKRQKTEPLEDWTAVERPSEDGVGYDGVVECIRRMPETYRSVLEMRFVEEMTGREIARALGMSEGAVNTRISRGRALLIEKLREEGITP